MALTTFLTLQTELYARGFDWLNQDAAGQTRAKTWLNQAYLELCEEENWPFLLTTATGTAPLTIADLRMIKAVVDTVQDTTLEHIDEETLRDYTADGNLSTTGSPAWYWIDTGTIITTYPAGGTLSVRYWKVPVELSADSDAPVVPQRFRGLIVDGAVRRANLDRGDRDSALMAEEERQRGLLLMRRSLLWQDSSNSQLIVTGAEDW